MVEGENFKRRSERTNAGASKAMCFGIELIRYFSSLSLPVNFAKLLVATIRFSHRPFRQTCTALCYLDSHGRLFQCYKSWE